MRPDQVNRWRPDEELERRLEVNQVSAAHQANTAGQAVARVDDSVPRVSVAAGRTGFKAELDDLRERMRQQGLGYDEIAGEIARRYRLRPRESYRLAYGWTLEHAAARFNALAAQEGTDPQARAGMTGPHLCERERWPSGGRKPSVYVLLMLAQMYETDVLRLLDLADHENLAPQDRLTLTALVESETRVREEKRAIPRGHAPGQPSAGTEGLSLSLPYVPGRLVIEVSAPVVNAVRAAPETRYPEQASGQLALVQNLPYSGQRDGADDPHAGSAGTGD
jgi:hypothetical protein